MPSNTTRTARYTIVRLAALAWLAASTAGAQAPSRTAATVGGLLANPFFFHGKQVVVRHAVTTEGDLSRLADTARPVYVFWRERPSRSEGEIRGEFWDLGRFEPEDSRFAGYDFRPMLEAATRGQWPPRDRLFVLLGATMMDSPLPETPTMRAIALSPATYEGRAVTVNGRFKGNNLYGDLPQGPGQGKWDFVLQSADAAIWVTALRPRGKGFDLDPLARVDTGRWLEVSGTVRREGVMVWIEGRTVAQSAAPSETPVEVAVPILPKEPPPSVVFSAPVADDTDVGRDAPVRLQFSRDLLGRTIRNAVRVSFVAAPGTTPPPPPPFTATYNEGNRSLEIRFTEPLPRFQVVQIELLEGITAVDGQPLAPWALTFTTGG